MAAENFQPGDVVQLNSGGPKMTIWEKSNNQGWWFCKWFNPAGVLVGEQFPPYALTKLLEDASAGQ